MMLLVTLIFSFTHLLKLSSDMKRVSPDVRGLTMHEHFLQTEIQEAGTLRDIREVPGHQNVCRGAKRVSNGFSEGYT